MNSIVFPLTPQMAGQTVMDLQAALQALLKNSHLLGNHPTNSIEMSTELEAEQTQQFYGGITTKLVAIFQQENQLSTSGSVDEVTAKALNDRLAGLGLLDQPQADESFVVHGTLAYADGRIAAGMKVQAFDRDMRTEELLGEAVTDAKGSYKVTYSGKQFQRAEKNTADLKIKVVDASGGVIATSSTFFNALSDQTIDIVLQKNQGYTGSEYERYLSELKPLIGSVEHEALTDEDFEFLTGETGISLQHLSYLRLDAQWQSAHDVEAAAFYGLLRKGLPANLPQLLAAKSGRLRELLKLAIAESIVPTRLGDQLDDIVRRLREIALERAFQQEAGNDSAPVGLVVATAGVTQAQQKQFVSMALDHEPKVGSDFWQDVQSALGDVKAVRAMQRSLQTSVLALHHLPVLKQVVQETQGDSVKTLAGWSETEWLGVVDRAKAHGSQVPKSFANAEDYAKAIVKKVDAYLTSDRLVARAKRSAQELTVTPESPLLKLYAHLGIRNLLATNGQSDDPVKDAVQKKLDQFDTLFIQNPTLDLRKADLVRGRIVLHGQETSLEWGDIPEADRPRILNQARAFQRVMPLADNTQTRISLLSAGIDSSHKVLGMSAESLAMQTNLSLDVAKQTQRAASNQAQRVEVVRRGWSEILFGLTTNVDNLDKTVPESFQELDDFQQLFGAQNFCDCAHCSSILSQSAYFVDLMAFVDRNVSQDPDIFGNEGDDRRGSALNLKIRRPDLWTLELSCKNIDTVVPYLEVANHIFEQFLIGHLSVSNRSELYQRLAEITPYTSFRQPYLPAWRELNLYLSHFGLKRADVLSALGRPAETHRLAHLKVSLDELAIMAEPDANASNMRRLFRVEVSERSSDPLRILVPNFMRASGLSRGEVTQLRKARTLQPFVFELIRTAVDGSLGQRFETEALQAESQLSAINRLDVIHRWLRLWRKTGWSLVDFDFVLSRLNSAGFGSGVDEAAVRGMASVKLLQDRLSLSVEELVCLFYQIPTPFERSPEGDAPFFEAHGVMRHRLFGEDPLTGTLTFTDDSSANTKVVFSNDSDVYRLLAGLSLSEPELFALLIDLRHDLPDPEPGGSTVPLTPANLSMLYRHALLARKLQCSTADLFPLLRLVFGLDQTAVNSVDDMLRLAEQLPNLEALPFSLADLRWLVLDEASDSQHRQATEAQLAQLRADLPTMDETGLHAALGNIYGWKRELSEEERDAGLTPQAGVVLTLAGVTLEALQTAAAEGDPEAALRPLLDRLEKWHLLQINLEFELTHQRFIADNASLFGETALPDLAMIRRLTTYRELTSGDESDLVSVHIALRSFGERRYEGAALLLQAEPSLVASLLQDDVMTLAPTSMDALAQLQTAVALCKRIGVSGNALTQMASHDYPNIQVGRDAMLGAFQAKYPDEVQREKLLEPYTEAVLELRRDVLVDYLLSPTFAESNPVMMFNDRVDLYRFFLMDAEMEGCARTSWVLAGISSVQLYVQRCLMNLEQSGEGSVPEIRVSPSAIPQDEWAWRKNYRVWEASRRVFLYPENYLYSDLRDDKTPFFEEAVEELQQQEINQDTAESAYKNYFDKFMKVANMKYAGACYESAFRGGPLYLFAHTSEDPPQYHYRTFTPTPNSAATGVWSHWHKIDLPINAKTVSPFVHQGKLYVFWVDIKTRMINKVEGGNSELEAYAHTIDLNYSFKNTKGAWEPKTKLKLRDAYEEVSRSRRRLTGDNGEEFTSDGIKYYSLNYDTYRSEIFPEAIDKHTLTGFEWDRVYPFLDDNGGLALRYAGTVDSSGNIFSSGRHNKISFLSNSVETTETLFVNSYNSAFYMNTELAEKPEKNSPSNSLWPVHQTLTERPYGIQPINNDSHHQGNYIVLLDADSYLLNNNLDSSQTFTGLRLGTSRAESLGKVLHEQGIDKFLSIETQSANSETNEIWVESDVVSLVSETEGHIDFEGACGNYYREMYFHLPFQIAENLNANQKFAEAQRWYHYIFDPTAAADADFDKKPEDRNWRYAAFRGLALDNLRDMLTDPAAIAQYSNDPFNPWAIAKLRPGALQKTVVMKYIDNLLDWGDHLFTQDSYESINEATLLYITALDILGERPVQMGACAVPDATTYKAAAEVIVGEWESEFVVLENYISSNGPNLSDFLPQSRFERDGTFSVVPSHVQERLLEGLQGNQVSEMPELDFPYLINFEPANPSEEAPDASASGSSATGKHLADMSKVRSVFCVPVNEQLLGYWDRVEDRLFKIRNCMNIRGMRRALALYAPRIDPMFLVRAKAAGLSLEDVLAPSAQPPIYRFTVLIERAKALAGTVQGFGGALLSALEKKDAEEMNLMRARHEQNIISLTKKVKENQIAEAQRQRMGLEASQVNINQRVAHFEQLIDTGLNGWERTQQVSLHTATGLTVQESVHHIFATISHLVPELGSPFALKFGGKQCGDSLSATASVFGSRAKIQSAISSSAGLEASNQRRADEWVFQRDTAKQELKQIEQQIEAAKLREEIAERDLVIYNKSVEQTREQYDFVKGKFTQVGLYNWMVQHLMRLHRDAYLLADEAANQAEQAYNFERDSSEAETFIEASHWEQDKAGLLAGERLMVQLQQMDQRFHATNQRLLEITKQVSLAMLNPAQLIQLRETGKCSFKLPELLFNLDFPGHFQRRIKAVRITIPCVTGPYTNVNAKLTLDSNRTRWKDDLAQDLSNTNLGERDSIATSSAQGDGGVFEFSFRDERYLPFEGAGAVSSWTLELPSVLPQFDYDTISDVVMHLSYTAKQAGEEFEEQVKTAVGSELNEWLVQVGASGDGLHKVISLRQEFGSELHRFLQLANGDTVHQTKIAIEQSHFPFFLRGKGLTVQAAHVILQPREKEDYAGYNAQTLELSREPQAVSSSARFELATPPRDATQPPPPPDATQPPAWGGLPTATFSENFGSALGEWTITFDERSQAPISAALVEDVILVLRYTVE